MKKRLLTILTIVSVAAAGVLGCGSSGDTTDTSSAGSSDSSGNASQEESRASSVEITPLLIMSELQEYDYASATSIALVMLLIAFVILFINALIQSFTSRIISGIE